MEDDEEEEAEDEEESTPPELLIGWRMLSCVNYLCLRGRMF